MTSEELLKHARDLTRYADPSTAGRWSRAAALLTRQALEGALDDLWAEKAPAVARCSAHAQLLCLDRYLGDAEASARASFAWASLSRACHHHVYELAPTAAELSGWIDDVDAVLKAVSKQLESSDL